MAEAEKLESECIKRATRQLTKTTDPVERCKLFLLKRGPSGIRSCGRWFKIMDDDGNRKLTKSEFTVGMAEFGVKDTDLNAVFDTFDKDGSGSINFDEFLINMQPAMSKNRKDLVTRAFDKFNKDDGDDVITIDDLKGVYNVSQHPKYKNGQWDRKRCQQEFLKTFDNKKDPDNEVTRREFEAYYSAISCSIDDDAYFDLMIRQAWDLD